MKKKSDMGSLLGIGAAAGLAGTGVMMAMRMFDQRYSPRTIPKMREDPGAFMVHRAERMTGLLHTVPKPLEKTAALATHTGYGTMFGALYGLLRGRGGRQSVLGSGLLLGAAVYAAGYAGWLPALGIGKPIWKQKFPEVAGEAFRHLVYGVTTAAVYEIIDEVV
jgi:uncharacterized membrane protein YagU involved in acid resistance